MTPIVAPTAVSGAEPQPRVAPASAAVLDAATRRAALAEIRRLIQSHYVFADRRAAIIARLDQAARSGRYAVRDPAQFAQRVSEDLQAASNDGHLYFRNEPAEYRAALAPAESEAGLAALRAARAMRDHHGLTRMEILPGNIRYLRIARFHWVADGSTARAYAVAADFLTHGDAIIIDLRGNGGGESDAADRLLENLRTRRIEGNRPNPRWQRPTYLLIDGLSASAAEGVAYSAKLEGVATLVGATTYGAANNVRRFPVAPSFMLAVSYHRPVHPLSGTNWEGVGVSPDLAVQPLQALDRAQLDALDRLAGRPGANPDDAARYRWLRTPVAARLSPPQVADAVLRGLAGQYGTIEIGYDGEALRLTRADRPTWPRAMRLIPLGEDLFALDATDDIRVRLTGPAVEIVTPGGGQPTRFQRNADPR